MGQTEPGAPFPRPTGDPPSDNVVTQMRRATSALLPLPGA